MVVHSRAGDVNPLPNPVTVDQLIAAVGRLIDTDGPVDGVAITGGEPLLQAEFLSEALKGSAIPRPRLLETSGTHPDRLPLLLPWIDIVSMDIKLPSNSAERAFWDEHERFLATASGKVYVKVLIDAGTDSAEVTRAAELIHATAPDTPVFLQPITAESGGVDLDQGQLDRFFTESRRHLADVRVLPQVHKLLRIP
jgi:organic radical activating enzyme